MAYPSPLYRRVKDRIREDLVDGRAQPGVARLPAERQLQARYGVSRPTISKALAELASEGLLIRSPGSGTFVVPPTAALSKDAPPAPRRIGYVAPIPENELTQRSLRGIERAARHRDYRVIFGNAGDRVLDEQAALRELIAAGVRGAVVSPVTRAPEELAADYLRDDWLGVPVVLIDTCLPEHRHPKVVFDNRRAGYQMTRWLLRRGHRRIGILTYDERWRHHATLLPRLQGYLEALQDSGIAPDATLTRRIRPDHLAVGVRETVGDWLSLSQPPTAIIASEDTCAMEVIDHLHSRGLRLPQDVQVMGWDHLQVARRYRPHFPTTNPDFERMGEIACDLLLRSLESGDRTPFVYVLDVPLHTHTSPAGAAAGIAPAPPP